jgi:hypothetical protein
MENFLTKQKAQAILDSRPDGIDIPTALKELSNQGFTIEGYNDKPVQSAISNVAGVAKSALGGIASGVGGIGLTAIDTAGRGLVNKFGTEQMKSNIAQSPTLNAQFKQQMGGNENPNAFGAGQLVGEIATLAAPVGAIGKVAKVGSEALGAGAKTAKLVQAGTEGAAFTAGMGLTENKPMSFEDYAINTGLNIALPGVGMIAKGVGENVPARIINSLIKPLSKDFAYGKNPGKSVAELVQPANDFEGLIANIKTTLNDVGSRIGQAVSQSPNLKQIDLSYTLKPIDDAIAKASQAKGTNATLIQRLQTVKQDLVDNINNGIDPQSYKGLVGDLTKWTGNVSDDALVNKSLKQVYGTTRQSMDDVLSKELSPEKFAQYKADSEAYGNLLSAKNAAEHRDKLVQRQDLISFGAKNSAMLAGLTTAVASGGAGVPAILAGIAGAGIDKALATPAFKTRMARLLSKLATKEVNTFFDKIPTAKSLFTESELKQFGSELKKNSSGQMSRGMINFSEWIPDLKAQVKSAEKSLSVGEKIVIAEDLGSTLSKMGINVGPITKNNVDDVIERAKKAISDERIIAKKEAMSTPAVKNMEARFKQNPTTGKLEGSNKVNSVPTKVYHGTPNDFKGEPNFPLYLTSDKNYADIYKNPSASSLSSGKKAGNPITKEFTVNPNAKVLDSRTQEGKELLKEYWSNYSVSGEQVKTKSGLPDWTEGTNLEEFLQEKGYKFDAILLDEGGVPSNNGTKSRGVSFVALNKNAFK